MPYVVLVLALVVGIYFIVRGLRGASPQTLASFAKWSAIFLGVALLLILSLRGGEIALIWIALGILPILFRWRSIRRAARDWAGPTAGKTSDVETRYLRMTLDHDTGELKGTVLEGGFKGRLLEELSREQLVRLLQECRVHDEQAAQILESYLDRVHGPEWRAEAGAEGGRGSGGAATSGAMTREEAYDILGLQPGATAEQIKEAHRKLMIKFHPDQGGSTYLAAKINQAKDLLMGDQRT